MFLKQVYKHNKWLFAAFVGFALLQLFINFKHGMVASPFLHYGMYSQAMKIKDSYDVVEVIVDGKMLEGKDFSPQQWDKITLPVHYFAQLNKSNNLFDTDIQRLMHTAHLSTNKNNYVQPCNTNGFQKWYSAYLQNVLGKTIHQVDVRYRTYKFQHNRLAPTDSMLSLAQLCY